MPVEIERKLLATGAGWRPLAGAGTAIRQELVCAESDRAVDVRFSVGQAKIAIKGAGKGIERLEYEYAIPVEDAREMLDRLCLGTVVVKTRYCVEHDGRVWGIDVFEEADACLVLAEVELNKAAKHRGGGQDTCRRFLHSYGLIFRPLLLLRDQPSGSGRCPVPCLATPPLRMPLSSLSVLVLPGPNSSTELHPETWLRITP